MRHTSLLTLCLLFVVALGGTQTGNAEPEGGETVAVTVHDSDGTPVAGARVSVLIEPVDLPNLSIRGPCRLAGGTTDKSGVVELPSHDPTLHVRLVVTPPDARWREFADAWQLRWKPADTTITLPTAHVLRGVVRTKDGEPVPLARVYCHASPWMGETTAGEDGTFIVENLPPGRIRLRAERLPPEKGHWQGPLSQLVEVATDAQDVVLLFENELPERSPGAVVRILTPHGRPVFQALRGNALLDGCAVRSASASLAYFAVTDPRTELGEPLPCGRGAYQPERKTSGDTELRLPEGLTIRGRVLTLDKKPAAGVRVLAIPARMTPTSTGAQHFGTPHGEGVSGPDGSFRVEGLEKRWYRLRAAWTPAYLPAPKGEEKKLGKRYGVEAASEADVQGVPAKAGAKGVTAYVRPAVTAWVTVVGDDSKPIKDALVDVYEVEDPAAFFGSPSCLFPPQQETDAEGRARLGGLDSDQVYTLVVGKPYSRNDLQEEAKTTEWRPKDTRVVLPAKAP